MITIILFIFLLALMGMAVTAYNLSKRDTVKALPIPDSAIWTLVAEYEASNDAGAINHNDGPNGASSYGLFQFYSGDGIVQAFVAWMVQTPAYADIGKQLSAPTPPSPAFNDLWKQIAKSQTALFTQAQADYATQQFYNAAVNKLLAIGIDASKRSLAFQNMVFSAAIQYNHRLVNLFQEAVNFLKSIGIDPGNDLDMIWAIYYLRTTDEWIKGTKRLIKRPWLEGRDCLNILGPVPAKLPPPAKHPVIYGG